MSSRFALLGAAATIGGILLIVGLLLPWWDNPSAFDDPKSLPGPAQFAAQAENDAFTQPEMDAFVFYEARDLMWLITGIAGVAFGIALLWIRRFPWVGAALLGIVALASLALLAASLISPPDYADLAPEPVDLGIDLPFDRRPETFVSLFGALAVALSALAPGRR